LKELEDYDWFPNMLRQYQTDYIGFVVSKFGIYRPFIKYLKSNVPKSPMMFDLCSGSGQPAINIFQQLNNFKQLLLSDKFPQHLTSDINNVSYMDESTDATKAIFKKHHTYTMFNAFHHFDDGQKQQMVSSMIASESEAYFVEILEPRFLCFIKVLLATLVGTILLTPFIRPFSFKRLLFTYLIPINLITITYDGMVSVYRSRTVKQYEKILSPYPAFVKIFKIQEGLHALTVIHIKPL
jgi:hypothetical protein